MFGCFGPEGLFCRRVGGGGGGCFGAFTGVEFSVAEFCRVDPGGPVGLGGGDEHPFFALRWFRCVAGGDLLLEILLALEFGFMGGGAWGRGEGGSEVVV